MATNPPAFDDNYQTVPERIVIFREKYPEGSLRPLNPEKPFDIVEVGEQAFVVCVTAAFRHPLDPAPGVGTAWCPLPGHTEYTLYSEIMNAETSSWGRAIVATLAADATKIASREEIHSAQSHRQAPSKQNTPPPVGPVRVSAASANGVSVRQAEPPQVTDPTQEEYHTAVIGEAVRLMDTASTTYNELRDVWQILSQAGLGARRTSPPTGMEPDGDGMVPILSAVAFVGKQRKDNPPAEVADDKEKAGTR